MRINYVLPGVRLTGGVRVILEIANGLARRGHEVTVTAFGKEGDADWCRPAFRFLPVRRRRLHKYRVAAARRLIPGWHEQTFKIERLAARAPDCDVNVATAAFTAFSVHRSGRGLPFHHLQHYDAVFYPDDPHAQSVAIGSCSLPLRRIANSTWLANLLGERHGLTDVALVHPAIDHEIFRPDAAVATRPSRPEGFRIVALGRPDPVKGFADLLEAVALAARGGRRIDLVAFGPPGALPTREGVPYRHAGLLMNQDLADLYRSADAVVTASWYESFPLPPLEAMACGVPVITTRFGTEDYAVHEENALVVPPRAPERLAAEILRLAGDERLRETLARRGPETARRFTWDAAIDRVERLFEQSIARHEARPAGAARHGGPGPPVPLGAETPRSGPELSILVVSWNTRNLLRECLRSALRTLDGIEAEAIVVDNASTDGSAEMVRREFAADPRVRLIANAANEGFARGNNQAFAAARGAFLAVVNPDVAFDEPALPRMVRHLRDHPGAGIVSCDLVGADGAPQSLHRSFPTLPRVVFLWTAWGRRLDKWLMGGAWRRRYRLRHRRRRGVAVIDQAAGACLVLRRTTVERIGGLFDERFPIFFNDVDLSRRVRDAGLEVHVLYDLKARHVGGASVRQMPDAARRLELLRGLEAYYDRHEPPWKRRLVRSLIAGEVRRAAALDPSTPSAAPPPPGSA